MDLTSDPLLERGPDLRTLEKAAADLAFSGATILVSGEAGFGKTALIRKFVSSLDHRFLVLFGTCDAFEAPVAYTPLYEMLDRLPAELRSVIREQAGFQIVNTAMFDVMRAERTVLILEDVHWADEATLGLIRHLGRRITEANSLLVLSYRPEELDPAHPLQSVLADVGTSATRVELAALSLDAVRLLAADTGLSPEAVHAVTLGNPFFVDQVLRQPEAPVPESVSESVLASARQLPAAAMELLEMVALSPEGLELELIGELRPDAGPLVDMAHQRRLLEINGGRVRCRHELIRASVERSMPPARRQRFHSRLLAALEKRPASRPGSAALAHHSVHSGDGPKAIRYSLEAAREALAAGAHRQVAVHYANVLTFQHMLDVSTLDEVLLASAREQSLLSGAPDTAEARLILVGDDRERAAAQAWVGFFAARADDFDRATRNAEEAIVGLQPFPPSPGLALALSVRAAALMAEGAWEGAEAAAAEAMRLAEATGATDVYAEAAITHGTVVWQYDPDTGLASIERAGEVAEKAGWHQAAARALNNLGVLPAWSMNLVDARAGLEVAASYAKSHELDPWVSAVRVSHGGVAVAEGNFDEAMADLTAAFDPVMCASSRSERAVALAMLLGRIGDKGAAKAVEMAIAEADVTGTYLERASGTALALEAAWLGLLDEEDALTRYRSLLGTSALAGDPWTRERLGFWAIRLGVAPPGDPLPGPVGLEAAGDGAAAARMWEKMGFPVEAAVTAAVVPGAALNESFALLDEIGAVGVSAALRRRLHQMGIRGVPRGDRPSTRQHPEGLTRRQAEVLELVAKGMTDAAIARELFISTRTASHHVSAILRKLGVANRGEAIAKILAAADA